MRPTADSDWISPSDVDVAADKERPSALGVWKCDGEGAEPSQYATLIEATGEPPRTPEAQVYGCGALLAASDDGVAVWVFTEAGMRRIEVEGHGMLARDSDTVLAVMLREDLACAGAS